VEEEQKMTSAELQRDFPYVWAAIYAAGRRERERARASIAKVRASDEKRNEPPPDSDSPPSPVKPYEEMICAGAWHRSTVD
jgi:hypothetical protein